jgi:hypothetical protein
MNPKSALNKGKRAEKEVCRRIERMGLGSARREAGSGNGLKKGDIFANLPFLIEVKNQKTIHFGEWVAQAKKQASDGQIEANKWCLVVIDPAEVQDPERMEIYATIELDEFLSLLKRNQEPKIKEPDRSMKWKLEKLRQVCKEVINELE